MTPTTDPHLRADARRNRDRLLAAAHEAFQRHGVSASLDDVAKTAHVGIGTLYRHFPTRDDLIAALVTADLERVAALADELATHDDAEVLGRWLGELVDHTASYRGLAEAVLAAGGDPTTRFGGACERLHTAGARLVRREQQRGTVRTDVDPHDVLDLANAIAWATDNTTDALRRRRLLRINIDGLRATSGADPLADPASP
jgi:AcrR family transcriptional regulator